MKDYPFYLLLIISVIAIFTVMDHYGWPYPNDPQVKGAL